MKKYIIVFCIVVLYIGIAFLFSNNTKNELSTKYNYIIFDDNSMWKVNNKRINQVKENKKILAQNKFYTYINGSYFGKYNISNYENDIYIFDENQNSMHYEGIFFASTQSSKLKIYNMNEKQIIDNNDISVLKKILKDDKIVATKDNLRKYFFDIDKDGQKEKIYSFSNMFSEENIIVRYSIVFILDGDEIRTIVSEKYLMEESFSKGFEYSIAQIGDINNDNTNEIVLIKSDYGSPNIEYLFYKSIDGSYKLIKS